MHIENVVYHGKLRNINHPELQIEMFPKTMSSAHRNCGISLEKACLFELKYEILTFVANFQMLYSYIF